MSFLPEKLGTSDPRTLARRTIAFVNIAHALDHFVLLVYPTAVLAIAVEQGLDYAALIGLSTGTFVAFGLFSLPVGWLADRFGRRSLLAAFFIGSGLACLGTATATTPVAFAIWLLVLGIFAAVYHPIGSTMLVANTTRLGRALGFNGVCGNLGAASASGITAGLAAVFGWRAGFIAPGLVCIAAGIAFLAMVPKTNEIPHGYKDRPASMTVSRPVVLLLIFALVIIAGGMTFNMVTISLPKVIDERLGLTLPLALIGSLATLIFLLGALMQLAMGRLVDRFSLPSIFVGLAILQPLGLGLAAMTTGIPLLLGLALAMSSIYGQVVVNDSMVARFIPPARQAKAYSVRYFIGFTTSGFAVPLIALLHERGGFGVVLALTTIFGAAIFACSLAFLALARPQSTIPAAPQV